MFDHADAATHLLRRGLLPATDRERASPEVRLVSGRNLLFRFAFEGAAPLLLKRAVDDETPGGLEREACAYERIATCTDLTVARRVPRKLDYDPECSTLVLEFLPGHRPLGVRRGSGPGLDAELAADLGSVLAGLHSISPPAGDSRPPWILTLVHPPVGILREATREQLELVGRVQRSSTWREALGSLTEGWRPRSFVHGDLRFSNLLIGERRGSGGGPTLKLIDWELAGPGDPGWDVGWVVAEILVSRLRDLGEAFPLLRAFWAAYIGGPREAATHARLDSTLRWAAAASLQMAFEEAGPSYAEGVSINKLLEVGRSLLERPEIWIERVFSAAEH